MGVGGAEWGFIPGENRAGIYKMLRAQAAPEASPEIKRKTEKPEKRG
jgi:hypothetical protein